jgi:N-acetylglucosamine malate deacetylase 1
MAVVLVISPHAMDEALGCGGTMARHVETGEEVETLVVFGDGSGMDAKRRLTAPAAAAILGSASPRFAGMPENRSDTLPLIDVIATIEKAIAELRPQTLYVPHGGNLNIDHQTAFRAALTAARPVPAGVVRAIYAYEIPSSTEWAPVGVAAPFLPTRFVDVSATLPKKMRALDCYAAELRDAPHSRSVEGIRALAQLRGNNVGMGAAEAFMVVRELV